MCKLDELNQVGDTIKMQFMSLDCAHEFFVIKTWKESKETFLHVEGDGGEGVKHKYTSYYARLKAAIDNKGYGAFVMNERKQCSKILLTEKYYEDDMIEFSKLIDFRKM